MTWLKTPCRKPNSPLVRNQYEPNVIPLEGSFDADSYVVFPDPREDSKSRSLDSGLHYSYGVEDRALRWIYFVDLPRGLGNTSLQPIVPYSW